MTYFGFLLCFLVTPIVPLLFFRTWKMRGKSAAAFQGDKAGWSALAVQVALAVLYTTPWDNYLVATGVWYYNPAQVSGVLLGYVPLEEYTFFVLESILVGLWWQFLATRLDAAGPCRRPARLRLWSSIAVLVMWGGSLIILSSGWKPATYLGLILGWALPPIMIQLAFGADILWQRRKPLALLILVPALYLSCADTMAIRGGVWAIATAQSTGIFIGGLPLEEGVFFFVTVILLGFGMTLSLAPESRARLIAVSRALWEALPPKRETRRDHRLEP
jgi:lycopene cyclase domain-containing protein